MDAVLSSGDGGVGARLWEVLPHFTEINYASPLSLAFCNSGNLAMLNPALGQAVKRAGAETEQRQFDAMNGRLDANIRRMRDHGVTIAQGSAVRTAVVEAAEPVVSNWVARTEGGRDILQAFRAG